MTEPNDSVGRKATDRILTKLLRKNPDHKKWIFFILLVALCLSAALAYYLWFILLPDLWNWGFNPISWRAILSLLGALYLIITPFFPLYWTRNQFRIIAEISDRLPIQRHEEAETTRQLLAGKLRLAFVIFGLIPFIIALLVFAVYGSIKMDWPTLRWIFLFIVILFPATLYYLFNVSRRYSILSDLFSNMNRIGLLTKLTDNRKEQTRQQRVLTYLRKYEATYGPLTEKDLKKIKIDAKLDDEPERIGQDADTDTLSGVLTETRIPVVIATVLITVGWFLALSPFEVTPHEVPKSSETAVKEAGKRPAPELAQPQLPGNVPGGANSLADGVHSEFSPSTFPNSPPRESLPPGQVIGRIDLENQFAPNMGLNSFAFLGAYFFRYKCCFAATFGVTCILVPTPAFLSV